MKAEKDRRRQQPRATRRVLLDRNVWSYLADANAGSELVRSALSGDAEILVAPTVIYETLALSNDAMRDRHMAVLTMPRWRHLMPDAYSECMELLSEIRRCRPEWIRAQPDSHRLRWQRHDWTRKKGGFWEKARTHPAVLAEELGIKRGGQQIIQDLSRLEAKRRREQFRDDATPGKWKLSAITGTPNFPIEGWGQDAVHPWRFAGWSTMSVALSMPGHPYTDWLAAEIDLLQLDIRNPSWGRFWSHDVDRQAMPRFWLRWAFEWMQSFQKFTPGTPADASLATYWPECDVFVSADANIVRNVIGCVSDAPCALPDAKRIPGGTEGVEAVLALIGSQ